MPDEVKRFLLTGKELRALRRERGLSQNAFAAWCGWSRAYQSKLERATVTEVSQETLKKIEAAL